LRRLALLLLVAALAVAPSAVAAPASVAIFYYPWYGTPALDGGYAHWNQAGHVPPKDIASRFYPAQGLYSSSDGQVIRRQMKEIVAAGVDTVIVSWWGWGSQEDLRLPRVMAIARSVGLNVAIHIEPYGGRTALSVAADVQHLHSLGIDDFYVYGATDIAPLDWAQVRPGLLDVRLFAQTPLLGFALSGGFDGVYTYTVSATTGLSFRLMCKEAHQIGLVCAPSVGPGFDASRATPDTFVRNRDEGATYDSLWRRVIGANADEVTITSFNEWHEGTQIEPARRAQGAYEGYDGAWGLHGRAAETSYLERTLQWSLQYRVVRADQPGWIGG
jgi:glycoprotein endo-alpha-1,2-mannosidase